MKHLLFLLTLTVNCFFLNAQNDTAYFDDGSMVIGKGGIKVSIEGGNIVIDGSGINNGFKPGITVSPSTGKGSFPWVNKAHVEIIPDTVDWDHVCTTLSSIPPKSGCDHSFPFVRRGQWHKIEEQ